MTSNILEKIKNDPYLGVATFGSMGWNIDSFAHDYIYKRLMDFGFDSDDHNKWEATIICSALMTALCHEAAQVDPYDMDEDLSKDNNEILVHAMIHPENIATIINIEQGWKLVTTLDRMNDIIAGYIFSNKKIKGITSRHINDLEIDRDHTHVVVIQDTSISKSLIPDFSIDDFNIGVLSGNSNDYDEYDDNDEDDEEEEVYDDVYDIEDEDDYDDYENGRWIDYHYAQIDDIIDNAKHKSKGEVDLLDKFWSLIENKDSSKVSYKKTTNESEDNLSKLSSKELGNIPPKSKIKSNKVNSDNQNKDPILDKNSPFYKFITDEMKFLD